MTTAERLVVLKQNIQILTDSQDDYLTTLLTQAEAEINLMGITDDGSTVYDTVVIDMAAYKWRKRATTVEETKMPRFLKRDINALLFSQKIQEAQS